MLGKNNPNDKKNNEHKDPLGLAEDVKNKAQEPAGSEKNIKKDVLIPQEEFEQLKSDASRAKEYWDRLLRQQADFDNIRKRFERERQEFQKYAHEDIVVDLLEVLDDLERSVEAAEKKQENFEAFLKGIEMIVAHLYDLLKKRGVTTIKATGEKFDPNQHEALLQTESKDHNDGEIIEEMQKGYKIDDRVIRTAKVRVAKKVEKEK